MTSAVKAIPTFWGGAALGSLLNNGMRISGSEAQWRQLSEPWTTAIPGQEQTGSVPPCFHLMSRGN